MIDYTKLIIWSFGLFGLSTAALVFAIKYVLNRLADRLSIEWKKSADKSIATLQAELSKNNNILNSLMSFQTSSHTIVQNRRIEGIQKIWNNVVELGKSFPPGGTHVIDELTVKQYESYWEQGSNQKDFPFSKMWPTMDQHIIWSKYISLSSTVDFERPFIGEKMWEIYNLHTFFIWRVTKLFLDGAKDKKFIHWFNDDLIKTGFTNNLNSEEVNYIYSNEINSYKNTCKLLEAKIIEEINTVLSGHSFAEDALARVKRLEKVLNFVDENASKD